MKHYLLVIFSIFVFLISLSFIAQSKDTTISNLSDEDSKNLSALTKLRAEAPENVQKELSDFSEKMKEINEAKKKEYNSLSEDAKAELKKEKEIIGKLSTKARIMYYKNEIKPAAEAKVE